MKIEYLNPIWCRISKDGIPILNQVLYYKSTYWRQGPFRKVCKEFNKPLVNKDGTFLTGFLPKVFDYLKKNGIKCEWAYHLYNKMEIKYWDSRTTPYKQFDLRPEQEDARYQALFQQRGVIHYPTGSGKTIIFLSIISAFDRSINALILLHRQDLLYQTYEQANKIFPGEVGIIGDGKKEPNRITIAMVQTLSKMERSEFHEKQGIIIVDECFTGNTLILLNPYSSFHIKDIFERKEITCVLSYNHITNAFEIKKILRKIRKPTQSYCLNISIKSKNGIRIINCTPNHKIFCNGTYIEAGLLKVGDKVKMVSSNFHIKIVCRVCGKIFDSKSEYQKHRMHFHYMKTKNFLKNVKRAGRIRGDQIFGDNNPSRNPLIIKKMGLGVKRWWDSLSEKERLRRITIFQNAPICKGHVSSLEQKVLNFNIPGLHYTGDGKFWRTFKNGKRKNPDFLFEKGTKIIEVGDEEFWHNEKEFEELKLSWKKIGYNCLTLLTKDFKDPNLKGKIEKFLFNHEGKIILIKKHISRRRDFVYNLEIEDNHNYFANGILVSNCHHISSFKGEYYKVLTQIPAPIRLGFTGTLPYTEEGKMALEGLIGPVIAEKKIQEVESLAKINIKLKKLPYSQSIHDLRTWKDVYKMGVVYNSRRHLMVLEDAVGLVKQGKTVLILLVEIQHGLNLIEMAKNRFPHLKIQFVYGHTIAEDRVLIKKLLNDKGLDIVISNVVWREGIDIPSLGAIVNAAGGKSEIMTIQSLGRGLRTTEDKKDVYLYDYFDPSHHYLISHFGERLCLYFSEGWL